MICFITKIFFSLTIFVHIKMSYYWLNRPELLQKARNEYHNCEGKEKAAKYYLENRYFQRKSK